MIVSLNHVNVRVRDVQRTLRFYADVLGMHGGPVPGQPEILDSAWIYAGDGRPVLHVGEGALVGIGSGAPPNAGSGSIDHVALECTNYDAFRASLEKLDVVATFNDVPAVRLRQIFLTDPDGVCLELNFLET